MFFLTLSILQCLNQFAIPGVSPIVAAMPLIVIVALTATKDGVEDFRRHKTDRKVNHQTTKSIQTCNNMNTPFFEDNTRLWGRITLFIESLLLYHRRGGAALQRQFSTRQSLKRIAPIITAVENDGEASSGGAAAVEANGKTLKSIPSLHKWQNTHWKDIKVGDFVMITDNEPIPADIFVLATSEPDCLCYVETKNLDGETNLKIKRGIAETSFISRPDECVELGCFVDTELPNPSLYSFTGALVIPDQYIDYLMEKTASHGIEYSSVDDVARRNSSNIQSRRDSQVVINDNNNGLTNQQVSNVDHELELLDKNISQIELDRAPLLEVGGGGSGEKEVRRTIEFQLPPEMDDDMDDEEKEEQIQIPLNINNLLLRGSFIRNTEWVIGLVLFTGDDTKIRMNAGATPSKQSAIEKKMNPQM